MKTRIIGLLIILANLNLFAYTSLSDYIISPTTVKKIGIYKFQKFASNDNNLFLEFQNDLIYELESVFYFDVYDYNKMFNQISTYYKNNPFEFLNSFDALAIGEIRSNQNLYIKIYLPKATDQREFFFKLEDKYDKTFILQLIKKELEKKLVFSGEIIDSTDSHKTIINLGENFNIKPNQLFVSFKDNRNVNTVLKVNQVNNLTSLCSILFQDLPLSSGDTVTYLTPDFLKNLHSKNIKTDINSKISLTNVTKVWGVSGKNIFISSSPYENNCLISDKKRTFLRNLDSHKSKVLEQNVLLNQVEWNQRNKTLAYSFDKNLVVYFINENKKFYYINGVFTPSSRVYDKKNVNLILDFKWSFDGKTFVFFIKNQGLYITSDFKKIKKLDLPNFYNDVSKIQLSFSGDNEALYIKYPNNFDDYYTILYYNLLNNSITESSKQIIKGTFQMSKDYTGILDYEYKGNKTNWIKIQKTNSLIIKPKFSDPLHTSANNQISFNIKNKHLFLFDNNINYLTQPNFPIVNQTSFFPSSEKMLIVGFLKDSNKDNVINWKDNNGLYLYNPLLNTVETNLLKDIDELMEVTPSGQYIFYRKGSDLFSAQIK